jgi:hypothetical protein
MSVESDQWAALEGAAHVGENPSSTERTDRLTLLADQQFALSNAVLKVQADLERVESEIARLFPEQSGEWVEEVQGYEVQVSRSERWVWDKDVLEDLFKEQPLPEHVKRTLSVDKRKFKKLPMVEQEQLRDALTRKLDAAKIKVMPL